MSLEAERVDLFSHFQQQYYESAVKALTPYKNTMEDAFLAAKEAFYKQNGFEYPWTFSHFRAHYYGYGKKRG